LKPITSFCNTPVEFLFLLDNPAKAEDITSNNLQGRI